MKKLTNIQSTLKAPKGQYNSFGKYKYRNAEDILEAVKPLLAKQDCTLIINDEIVLIGERYYIKAVATIRDNENNEEVSATAYAREADGKKGMDDAQVTGATSSYARKYALNGLFCIDDTKDADSQDNSATFTEAQKRKIDAIKTREQGVEYYKKSRGKGAEHDKYLKEHMDKIKEEI